MGATGMGAGADVPCYFPPFIWKLWLSETDLLRKPVIHIYDVYDNVLSESASIPSSNRSIFHDLTHSADSATRCALWAAEEAFANLEREVEKTLSDIICHLRADANCKELLTERRAMDNIRKYFLFLRFRNCEAYRALIHAVREYAEDELQCETIYSFYHLLVGQLQFRIILRSILAFLTSNDNPLVKFSEEYQSSSTSTLRHFREAMESCCWSLLHAEISVGIARGEQEYILPGTCYGTLTEYYKDNLDCYDLFFPILPTFAIYIMGSDSIWQNGAISGTAGVSVGVEYAIDVHLRNAMILNTYPKRICFNSLESATQTLSCYDEFRWIPEHQDYSRLKWRCRQKFIQQSVSKTLVIKGSIALVDLTEQISLLGDSPLGFGSFSDIWKGVWKDQVEGRERLVAVKYLRECMFSGVQEQLKKRLQAECMAWHRLCHRNVSQLYGLVQKSRSIGMVSPWCENGTITEYIKNNLRADRMKLLFQVSSGMVYLHSCQPVVIHGDLKGGNILIDKHGYAVISDFGLSKVMEGMTEKIGSSFFAGSTRWMAPELIQTLVEDNGDGTLVTTYSDVFAFAAVCLEVVTGELPYPHRLNEQAVLIDILRGVRPCRGILKYTFIRDEDAFWGMLDKCWSDVPIDRPTMQEMVILLQSLMS